MLTICDINKGKHPLENKSKLLMEHLKLPNVDIFPKTPEFVEKFSPFFLQQIKTKQTIQILKDNWYISYCLEKNIKYMCFDKLLMIDIDNLSNDINITSHFHKQKDYAWSIYKSTRGYHVFCISREFAHDDLKTVEFMLNNFCDYYYTIFSFLRGFCVRLSHKQNKKGQLYKHLGIYGNTELINSYLLLLTDSHVTYCDV